MDIRIESQARGMRLITKQTAALRRQLINVFIEEAEQAGFDEIVLPCVEPSQIYADKAGSEILSQMYTFPDRAQRELCLRPEGTATCQLPVEAIW